MDSLNTAFILSLPKRVLAIQVLIVSETASEMWRILLPSLPKWKARKAEERMTMIGIQKKRSILSFLKFWRCWKKRFNLTCRASSSSSEVSEVWES